jgi:hypothetical protein
MSHRFGWVAAIVLALAVGVVGYNIGMSHGLALAARASAAPGAPPYPPYLWYRPWGFGLGPLLLVAILFVLFRRMLWGGSYRHGWTDARTDRVPPRFEEWHRRAHAQMSGQNSQPNVQPEGRA